MDSSQKMIIFCDFDGTITKTDNIIRIMKFFNPQGWEEIKNHILTEQVSIQEGVGRMFSLLPTTKQNEITQYAVEQVEIRPGFDAFIQYCEKNKIKLLITSGGIDFFVYPILSRFNIPKENIYCNGSDFSGNNINILWPYDCDSQCQNHCGMCKTSIIRSFSTEEDFKIVIGDSITDVKAAESADLVIARDFLLKKRKEQFLPSKEFDTFFDVIDILKPFFKEKEGLNQ